jgi:hypothetical protein
MSETSEQDPRRGNSPHFFAWCDEGQRLEAFVTAVSRLVPETRPFSMEKEEQRIRGEYAADGCAWAIFEFETPCGSAFEMGGRVSSDRHFNVRGGPINFGSRDWRDIFPQRVRLAKRHSSHLLEAGAIVACHCVMVDMQDILLRVCTANSGITTGGCMSWVVGIPPISMGATYNADGCVSRDLALSWVSLYDREDLGLIAGLPIDTLRERVEAAPRGTCVSVGDGGVLTREEVLAALSLGANGLLEALEAAAVTDDEWRDVEPLAIAAFEACKRGAFTVEVDVLSVEHARFIQRHAPFYVERLPNGGVLLATHPYRTLWQLWSDALLLLGIRTENSE